MEGFVKGDVVVLEFPFSNLMEIKRRPSLILKVPKGGDLIVSQITGSSYEPSLEVSIKNNDFKEGKLKIDSYLRLDKISSIERSLVKYKIGSLKKDKFNEILNKVCDFLKS